jgi:peptidyl-dipeptidase Dcp
MNPFAERSTLPAELPPFAEIRDDDYEPAFDRGMADQTVEVAAIIADREAPTFANTIEALERSGQVLRRVSAAFFTRTSSDGTDFVRDLEARLAPRLAVHEDAIHLNSDLFRRIETVWEQREDLGPEEQYLVERYHIEFTLAGAGLDEEQKNELKRMNERLSVLTTQFDANLVADTNALAVHLPDPAELDGLAPDERSAVEAAARARGLEGGLVPLVLYSGHPYLASLTRREVRERVMRASLARGSRGGAFDNREVLLEIVRLRARRARLLGFDTHAALVAADQTAKTPEAVAELLGRLAPPAARNAAAEAQVLEGHLHEDGVDGPLESWDWSYYAERERIARYDVDTSALRPYLEAERVLHDGVFFAANRLYGLTFTERPDLLAYHPEARVFEVHDEARPGSESLLGLYILDLYTRDTKRGGAWMNSLVDQSRLTSTPYRIVLNNLNVPKPAEGEPTLLTVDLAETLFHEFGHALHGLLATVGYPKLAGTSVPRDFVEFPSQVNEMWLLWPEVLANYARHYRTGEPIPQDLVERMRASSTFNEGFKTSEYLQAALLDQAWHRLSPEEADAVTDVAEFERDALEATGLRSRAVPPRYSSAYFAHVFSGGYSAAYYAYIWSEVLDADTVKWFEEHGGLLRENGDRFRQRLLGVGGSRDALEAYRDFRGREAEVEPLLERRGLTAA